MTIGEKIAHLRIQNHMSQGELAEKLNVSRQSVSKWETNTSIPELDKLILLSDLFQLSLDALVRDREPQTAPAAESHPAPEPRSEASNPVTQKRVGYVLLAAGLFCCTVGLLFNRFLFVMGPYLLLCSILCLRLKRNAGFVIAWITFLLFSVIGRYAIRQKEDYAVLECAGLCLLGFWTYRRFKRRHLENET